MTQDINKTQSSHRLNSIKGEERYIYNNKVPVRGREGTNKLLERLTEVVEGFHIEEFDFPTRVNGMNGPILKVKKLFNIDAQYIMSWTARYRLIMKQCEFDDSTAILYLKMVIDEKYVEVIENKRALETCLESLIKLKYNDEKFENIVKTLENLHVKEGQTVSEYYDLFNKLVEESDLCVEKSNRLTEREKFKYLESGLLNWK